MTETTAPSRFETFLGRIGLPAGIVQIFRVLAPPGVRLSGAGIQFLSTVLIARQLGDEKSAGFFFWSAVLTSFAPMATFGLEHLVLRNVPRLQHSASRDKVAAYLSAVRTFSFILSIGIGIGLLIYAFVRSDSGVSGFQTWHLLLPVGLSAMAITLINGEALKGLSRPIAGIFFGHFLPVSLFCLLIALNIERLSSPFLVVIYASAYVIALLLTRFGPSKTLRSKVFSIPQREQTRQTLQEGFPVFATNALGALCYITPLFILDFLRPAAEVAYVTTSFRISILLAILAAAIHGVFAPQLSKAAEIPGNASGIWKVYRKTTLLTLLSLAIPFGVGIAFPEWIMAIFGDQFTAGADTLRLLLISGIISVCLGPMLQLLLMTGNTRFLAKLGIIKLVLATVLSVLFIPSWGGIGMVIAMGVTFVLEEVVGLLFVRNQLRRNRSETEGES